MSPFPLQSLPAGPNHASSGLQLKAGSGAAVAGADRKIILARWVYTAFETP
jgi:hypothetical protein